MKLADYLMELIADTGVQHVFMLPGGGAMHLNDSLGRCSRLEYICSLHEQACAIAADAYSQYTNNLGVCMVTTGPGGTNALTGVAGAWMDSIPLLIISGQVKREDTAAGRGVRQMGFQEIDIISIAKPITKYAITVTEPTKIRYYFEKAVWMAQNGRPGPSWLDIPLDVQAADIEVAKLVGFHTESKESNADNELATKTRKLIEILSSAKRPVILAGNGIRSAQALDQFQTLIDILQIPVLTTWKAMDFLADDHPLYAGRPGAIGQRGANFTQQNADCLITIGARLDFGQTAYNHANFARSAQKIFVDIDPAELDKIDPQPTIPICADAGEFIAEILKQLAGNCSPRPKEWNKWLQKTQVWQQQYPVVLNEYREETDYVNDYLLIELLSREMTDDDLLIPGSSGACSERTMQSFKVKKGQRIFNSQGLGSMGFGLSAAIGGCVASGQKLTVTIEGDGGFAMNIQELETVRRLNLPIKIFILNNQGYGSIRNTQNSYFEGRCYASCESGGLTLPNWEKVAETFALPYYALKNHQNLHATLKEILKTDGPVFCEVMISPEQQTAPKVLSRKTADGRMETAPMEDMSPLLDRKKFRENMKNS